MTRRDGSPVVYGAPSQLALLLVATARVIEHEPDETFADVEVRRCGQQLSDLIGRRVAKAAPAVTGSRPDGVGTEALPC